MEATGSLISELWRLALEEWTASLNWLSSGIPFNHPWTSCCGQMGGEQMVQFSSIMRFALSPFPCRSSKGSRKGAEKALNATCFTSNPMIFGKKMLQFSCYIQILGVRTLLTYSTNCHSIPTNHGDTSDVLMAGGLGLGCSVHSNKFFTWPCRVSRTLYLILPNSSWSHFL